jgi:hypothetical protein
MMLQAAEAISYLRQYLCHQHRAAPIPLCDKEVISSRWKLIYGLPRVELQDASLRIQLV